MLWQVHVLTGLSETRNKRARYPCRSHTAFKEEVGSFFLLINIHL